MNLTYELTEKGYKIIKDGDVWLVQEDYFPHKGATIQESAELHIAEILKDSQAPNIENILLEKIRLQDEAIMELAQLISEVIVNG